jgi:ubiquinol-cytochrome c reductase cytochrome c subunit
VTIGPGVMPPFEFTQQERDDINERTSTSCGRRRRRGGAPIGGTGPVAEGFVAVVVGLTGLVLIARFAGSRPAARTTTRVPTPPATASQ